jgi:gas vesicle protein
MKSGKVLLGVLAGLAAGALLGVLFAPDKGSVTREKISGKAEALADEMKEKFNEFLESMKDKFDQANKEEEHAEAESGK